MRPLELHLQGVQFGPTTLHMSRNLLKNICIRRAQNLILKI